MKTSKFGLVLIAARLAIGGQAQAQTQSEGKSEVGRYLQTPIPQVIKAATNPKLYFFGGYQDAGNQSTEMLLSGSVGCYTGFSPANGAYWAILEPSQGNYNWGPLDGIASFCQAH